MSLAMWLAWLGMAGFVGLYGWGWQKAGEKGRAWLEWGGAVLVAGVSAVSVALHEPWRDELHAWLQAREMGLGALWNEMACEGHFIPWHLLLWPLAHFGAPVWTMGVVSWGLNAAAFTWLAKQSPLSGWEKAATGASCVFLYVNPVVSRCYVLVPLALFGVASLWGRRDDRPVAFGLWVALLANTHLYLEGAAVVLFGVYAWENVLRRKDGKGWRECGWQWAGLGVMAAGGALALAQVLPSLWKSAVVPGPAPTWQQDVLCFFQPCVSRWWAVAAVAGLALLGAAAWKKDKGVFWVYGVGVVYMWVFSVFLYGANIPNRGLLWWPMMLFAAWTLAGEGGGGTWWRVLAVVTAGLSIMRPDLTKNDWRGEYDPLRGACRWIEERYGKDVEVWINGEDFATEPAAVYLVDVKDWRTGKRAEPINWGREELKVHPFRACASAVFRAHPGQETFLALVSTWQFSGLTGEDFTHPGVEEEREWSQAVIPQAVKLVLLRVKRWGREWGDFGVVRYQSGDRSGAVAAWKRAVEEDGAAWEAMNNLAWTALEAGRLAEAREWIDRAMEHPDARASKGVQDTAAAIRREECVPETIRTGHSMPISSR